MANDSLILRTTSLLQPLICRAYKARAGPRQQHSVVLRHREDVVHKGATMERTYQGRTRVYAKTINKLLSKTTYVATDRVVPNQKNRNDEFHSKNITARLMPACCPRDILIG